MHDWNEGTTLSIGAYCSISSGVNIYLGGHHRADWVSSYPFPAFVRSAATIPEYGGSNGDVVIGNDVWLCANASILSGVTIGDGAVVANGALVTRDVPPYAIVGGNPAKILRYRFEPEIIERLLGVRWWEWPFAEVEAVIPQLCSGEVDAFLDYAESRDA
ncbi:CatB-related O-acetyltransferase [Aestuariirhabdus litorea]|uniref:CatB-related O-acetyltransferase n=1 Tax=Aestuariirhabdus litorea TaxID=2528527 RepID=UPI0024373B18|nr:CatB-related O-acetyltransferase [Aestuariirhabdus litorea]